MNAHLLLHLVNHVGNFGSLWTHAAFEFESVNSKVISMIHRRTHVEKRVLSAWQNLHSAASLEVGSNADVTKMLQKLQQLPKR
jgi:hypothetical protein